jgi:hypothetical protein
MNMMFKCDATAITTLTTMESSSYEKKSKLFYPMQKPSFWIWMFGSEGSMTYILVDEKHEWIQARAIAEKAAVEHGVEITRSDIYSTPDETRRQWNKEFSMSFISNTVIDTR